VTNYQILPMYLVMTLQTDVRHFRTANQSLIDALESDFNLMKDYLQMCVRKEDWHGVMDASADIREIVAKLGILKLAP